MNHIQFDNHLFVIHVFLLFQHAPSLMQTYPYYLSVLQIFHQTRFYNLSESRVSQPFLYDPNLMPTIQL